MESSSVYANYVEKLTTCLNGYRQFKQKISEAVFLVDFHKDNLNISKTLFKAGYMEDDGTTVSGDLIFNICNDCDSIKSMLRSLDNSVDNEIKIIQYYISVYTQKYNDAYNREIQNNIKLKSGEIDD